jgi:hypothetical protein
MPAGRKKAPTYNTAPRSGRRSGHGPAARNLRRSAAGRALPRQQPAGASHPGSRMPAATGLGRGRDRLKTIPRVGDSDGGPTLTETGAGGYGAVGPHIPLPPRRPAHGHPRPSARPPRNTEPKHEHSAQRRSTGRPPADGPSPVRLHTAPPPGSPQVSPAFGPGSVRRRRRIPVSDSATRTARRRGPPAVRARSRSRPPVRRRRPRGSVGRPPPSGRAPDQRRRPAARLPGADRLRPLGGTPVFRRGGYGTFAPPLGFATADGPMASYGHGRLGGVIFRSGSESGGLAGVVNPCPVSAAPGRVAAGRIVRVRLPALSPGGPAAVFHPGLPALPAAGASNRHAVQPVARDPLRGLRATARRVDTRNCARTAGARSEAARGRLPSFFGRP